MFAITIDQVASTRVGDRVAEFLGRLSRINADTGVILGFERTAGDEVQGLVDEPAALRAVVMAALRSGDWSVGIGVGAVDEPLPISTREATGDAYFRARAAVERAKRKGTVARLAVEAADADAAADLEAAFQLLAALIMKRTAKMWEAIDTVSAVGSNEAAARRLGISPQAVSERLRGAQWSIEQRFAPRVIDALAERVNR